MKVSNFFKYIFLSIIFTGCFGGGGGSDYSMGIYESQLEAEEVEDRRFRVVTRKDEDEDVLVLQEDVLSANVFGEQVIVGTDNGLFKIGKGDEVSVDSVESILKKVTTIFIDGNRLYAGGYDSAGRGVLLRGNSDLEFETIYTHTEPSSEVTSVLSDNEDIVLGTGFGEFIKSDDDGDTWKLISKTPGKSRLSIVSYNDREINIDDIVFYSNKDNNFYRFTDNLNKLQKIEVEDTGGGLLDFNKEENNTEPSDIYFITKTPGERSLTLGAENGLFKTFDFGATFTEIETTVSGIDESVTAVYYLDQDIIYLGLQGGILISNNGGYTWRQEVFPRSAEGFFTRFVKFNDNLYAFLSSSLND